MAEPAVLHRCWGLSMTGSLYPSSRSPIELMAFQFDNKGVPPFTENDKGQHLLHQHYLAQTHLLLALGNVTDIHQDILEKQSIHLAVHVVRIGMCPYQHRGIFLGLCAGPEAMWCVWPNHMWIRWACRLRCMDCLGHRISSSRADLPAQHTEAFGLLKMEMKWWTLECAQVRPAFSSTTQ